MNWNTLVMELRYLQPRMLAALVAEMWAAAAARGDEALLSNIEGNSLDPLGVANYLDWGGVPPSAEVLLRFGVDRGPALDLRPIFGMGPPEA